MSTTEQGQAAQPEQAAAADRLRDLRKQIERAQLAAQVLDEADMPFAMQLVQRSIAELQSQVEALEAGRESPDRALVYRHTYVVTVLTENPTEFTDLATIASEIYDGGSTGTWVCQSIEGITDIEQAREAVCAVGSEPSFFRQLAERDDDEDLDAAGDVVEAERGA